MSAFYDRWIERQAEGVIFSMREWGRRGGGSDVAVYVIPSQGEIEGRLVVADSLPDGATDVVRFPAQGSRVMWVPYSHVASLLWHACRSFPILPVNA